MSSRFEFSQFLRIVLPTVTAAHYASCFIYVLYFKIENR